MKLDELRREIARAAEDQPPVRADARHRVRYLVRRQRALRASVSGFVVVAVAVVGASFLHTTRHENRLATGPNVEPSGMPREIVAVTSDHRLVVIRSRDGHIVRELASRAVPDSNDPNADTPSLAVTPDGKTVYFMRLDSSGNGPTIASVPVAGGRVTPLGAPGCCLHNAAVSPDGRWLAFTGIVNMSDAGRDILLLDLTRPRVTDSVYDRRWTSGAALHRGVGPLAWAPDSQHLAFIQNDARDALSPRVLDINAPQSTLLDQLPAVRLPRGRPGSTRWAGYLGDTGELLGITKGNSQVIAIDPRTGVITRRLFTLRGTTAPMADVSGNHVVALGADGLYIWNDDGSTPRKLADHVLAAAWVP